MKWKGEKLHIASVSDIHLGHSNTPTEDILKRLKAEFPDNAETASLDLLIFAGDVFDKLLFLSDNDVFGIQAWIVGVLKLCKKHNIILRVLEGTPSHDRGQGKHFIELNKVAGIGADVKYVPTLSVEFIERLGVSVLYVPDEWEADNDSTWEQAVKAVHEAGLDQVDFAVMHGMFEYQLPAHLNFAHHLTERYLSLVKGYIFIGHVHQMSKFERILSQGSFDRISHNEEEDKGHWRVKCTKDFDDDELTFMVNRNATRYDTLDLVGLSLEDAKAKLDGHLKMLMGITNDGETKAHVRIAHGEGDVILEALDDYRKQYSFFGWKTKKIVSEEEKLVSDRVLDEKYTAIEINPNNIGALLEEELKLHSANDEVIRRAMELANGTI